MNNSNQRLSETLKQLEAEISVRETAAQALRKTIAGGAEPEIKQWGLSGMPLWQMDVMAQLQRPFSIEEFRSVAQCTVEESFFRLGWMVAFGVAKRIAVGNSWTFKLINEWNRAGEES